MRRMTRLVLGLLVGSGVLAAGAFAAAPQNQTAPSIDGKAMVGETLTADRGEWSNNPTTFTYQWQLYDKDGANCKDIVGATGKTYGVRSSDKDGVIRVQVTAKNLVGSTTSSSDTTAAVTARTSPTPTPTPTPTPVGVGGAISITAISLPNRLVISSIQFTPRVITSRKQQITARFRVTEATGGKAVAGALVYAIAVPSNQVRRSGEVQTNSTGWATVHFQPLKALPMKAGARVNFFVRARKAGENPLAGISTRRLVSVGVHPVR